MVLTATHVTALWDLLEIIVRLVRYHRKFFFLMFLSLLHFCVDIALFSLFVLPVTCFFVIFFAELIKIKEKHFFQSSLMDFFHNFRRRRLC